MHLTSQYKMNCNNAVNRFSAQVKKKSCNLSYITFIRLEYIKSYHNITYT